MSYIGGGPYYAEPCPFCGQTLWNGRCENRDCFYHWHPKKDGDEEDDPFDDDSYDEDDPFL